MGRRGGRHGGWGRQDRGDGVHFLVELCARAYFGGMRPSALPVLAVELHIQAEFGELFKVGLGRADEQPLFVPQARTVSSARNSPPLLFRGRREGVTYGRLLNRD